jgi:hypothetical protein
MEELKGNAVLVDQKACWNFFTQFDTVSKKTVGPIKTIKVFVQGSEFSNRVESSFGIPNI